jgi:hypothetical protein
VTRSTPTLFPPMRDTALGLFIAEPPTPFGQRLRLPPEVPMTTEPTTETTTAEHVCERCPHRPSFGTAAGLAIHRGRMHPLGELDEVGDPIIAAGYRGTVTRVENGGEPAPVEASTDDVLALLFPSGIPATVQAVEAVGVFVEALNQLQAAVAHPPAA